MRVDLRYSNEGKGYLVLAQSNLQRSASSMHSETSTLKSMGKTIKDTDAPLDVRDAGHNSTFTASNGARHHVRRAWPRGVFGPSR
jgi:hypothetical protein